MKLKSYNKKKSAYTLMEVIIVLAIIFIILLGVLGVIGLAFVGFHYIGKTW